MGDKYNVRLPSMFLLFVYPPLPHSYYSSFVNKDIVKGVKEGGKEE